MKKRLQTEKKRQVLSNGLDFILVRSLSGASSLCSLGR